MWAGRFRRTAPRCRVASSERSPRGKRYCYRISNRRTRSPLRRFSHWEIFQPLDVPAMREAGLALVGEHDFSGFRAADCQAPTAVRRLSRVELGGAMGDEITI